MPTPRWLTLMALWALTWPLGCAVKSDTILADQDAGSPFQEGQPPTRQIPSFDEITDYDGCDVDLTCTEGCDGDLDCNAEGTGAQDGTTPPPSADGLVNLLSADAGTQEVEMAANEIRWWSMDQAEGDLVAAAVVDFGAVELAVYAADTGALVARSTTQPALRLSLETPTTLWLRAQTADAPAVYALEVAPVADP